MSETPNQDRDPAKKRGAPESGGGSVNESVERYEQWSKTYWRERCLTAERELERIIDQLDSAEERIAQLEQQRLRLTSTDPLTGWPHGF